MAIALNELRADLTAQSDDRQATRAFSVITLTTSMFTANAPIVLDRLTQLLAQ